MHSITPARLLVMFSGAFLLAGNASAYVQQRVQLDYSGPAGATTHAADTVSVPPESALHTIHANIAGGSAAPSAVSAPLAILACRPTCMASAN